jgi:hypothetical protein
MEFAAAKKGCGLYWLRKSPHACRLSRIFVWIGLIPQGMRGDHRQQTAMFSSLPLAQRI